MTSNKNNQSDSLLTESGDGRAENALSLDEAIQHCIEVAEEYEDKVKRWKGDYPVCKAIMSCQKCADEHHQLAKWLKELKERREKDEYSGSD